MKPLLAAAGALAAFSAFSAFSASSAFAAPPQDTPAGVQRFRELYKELVETNTTFRRAAARSPPSAWPRASRPRAFPRATCTPSRRPTIRRKAAWLPSIPGRDPKLKAILLLAHIDVVEAKREDWTRDPFKLVEENGNFYARGAFDDKAEAAIWVDTLIRYHDRKLPAAAHAEGGAHLRRRNRRRIQWRGLADRESPRTHRRGIRPERRRGRRTGRKRQPDRSGNRGGREISAELSAGSHQSRADIVRGR